MNDWEAIHDSKSILETLNKEIQSKRESWQDLQSKWVSRDRIVKQQKSSRANVTSYLRGAMANSITDIQPQRSCLFEVSVREMTARREKGRYEHHVVTEAGASVVNPDIDKFSTELASISDEANSARSMIEFSRFLLQLSGEQQLADARDPTRSLDSRSAHPNPLAMKHDRLIR